VDVETLPAKYPFRANEFNKTCPLPPRRASASAQGRPLGDVQALAIAGRV
jgi:hypothetical protein